MTPLAARVGHGWDRHRLDRVAPEGMGRPLVVGGQVFESPVGPVAHSDGDALAHALTDAVLGAAGLGDIGQMFPDTDPAHEGADSIDLLARAVGEVGRRGWAVGNADVTVLLERPKLGAAREAVRAALASALGVETARVNVKGKTGEGVGVVGRGEAIEAHAVVLLVQETNA